MDECRCDTLPTHRRFDAGCKFVAPTENNFRDAGFTKDAANYPLSDVAFAALCAFNGVTHSVAPEAWKFAPNSALRDAWERVAAATGAKPLSGPLTHESLTAPTHEADSRISVGLGTDRQHPKDARPLLMKIADAIGLEHRHHRDTGRRLCSSNPPSGKVMSNPTGDSEANGLGRDNSDACAAGNLRRATRVQKKEIGESDV